MTKFIHQGSIREWRLRLVMNSYSYSIFSLMHACVKIIILGCICVTTNCCDLLFTLFKQLDRARWFDQFHKHSRTPDASGLVWVQ